MAKSRTPREASLYSLLLLLKRWRIPYNLQEIKAFLKDKNAIASEDLFLLLRETLKHPAQKKTLTVKDLKKLRFPAIVELTSGEHRLIEGCSSGGIAIKNPGNGHLEQIPSDLFQKAFSGVVIELKKQKK